MRISEIQKNLEELKAKYGDLVCSMDIEAENHGMSGPIKRITVANKYGVIFSNMKPQK